MWASRVSISCLEALLVACAGSTPRFPHDRFILVLGSNRSSLDHIASMREFTGAWSGVSKPTTSAAVIDPLLIAVSAFSAIHAVHLVVLIVTARYKYKCKQF